MTHRDITLKFLEWVESSSVYESGSRVGRFVVLEGYGVPSGGSIDLDDWEDLFDYWYLHILESPNKEKTWDERVAEMIKIQAERREREN